MKERPILFSGPMVRALLDGRKTQTRRLVKPQPQEGGLRPGWHVTVGGVNYPIDPRASSRRNLADACPFGSPGDRLWVRETFSAWSGGGGEHGEWDEVDGVLYGSESIEFAADGKCRPVRWRPSIHMPRWASRITLELTAVRIEPLQAISSEDAKAEGARRFDELPSLSPYGSDPRWSMEDPPGVDHCLGSPQMAFANLWIKLNGQDGWDSNPWVWVLEFKRVTP